MIKFLSGALLLVFISSTLADGARADSGPMCARRADIVRQFEAEFGEKPAAVGIGPHGLVVEVLAARTGTFTILVTRPDGISCILAAGEDWQWIGLAESISL